MDGTETIKNSDAVLIQEGVLGHKELLDMTENWHAAYCLRHGIDYHRFRDIAQSVRPPHWDKILRIQAAMEAGYDWIFWLDTDAVIVRPDVDLRTALPAGELGMTKYFTPYRDRQYHYSSGVIVLRNTETTREFMRRVWEQAPIRNEWFEQLSFLNVLFDYPEDAMPDWFKVLAPEWNASDDKIADPVIRAWHGILWETRKGHVQEAVWWLNSAQARAAR